MEPSPSLPRLSRGLAALALLIFAPPSGVAQSVTVANQQGPFQPGTPELIRNVVLLIGDDMGVDTLSSYGEGTDRPLTPVLDGLAASGVLFRNAWSQPVCSPTRAGIFTGRHGFRTGIGHIVTTTSAALSMGPIFLGVLKPATIRRAIASA